MIDNWIESVGHERLCWTSHHNAMFASLGIAEGGLKSGNQFSGNRAKGPAIVSVQSVCPEITDKAFVTHCAQLLSSWRSKVLLHLCLVVVETCRGQCGLSQSMEIWGFGLFLWRFGFYTDMCDQVGQCSCLLLFSGADCFIFKRNNPSLKELHFGTTFCRFIKKPRLWTCNFVHSQAWFYNAYYTKRETVVQFLLFLKNTEGLHIGPCSCHTINIVYEKGCYECSEQFSDFMCLKGGAQCLSD